MGENYWQGRRVRLRGLEPGDAEHFIRWNLDSERARHLDFLWPPVSEASVRAWVAEQSTKKLEKDGFHWIIETTAGDAAGSIVTHHCDSRAGTFSYALDVAPEHRRQGYASESIALVLRYYFHELRYQKCTVDVHSDNPASIGLHQALGFALEGTLRRTGFTHGQFFDRLWFGMTREEFETRFGA